MSDTDGKQPKTWFFGIINENIWKPLVTLGCGAIVTAIAALLTPLGPALHRGVNAAIYGGNLGQVPTAITTFDNPPSPIWATVPFQNIGPCLDFLREWARSEKINVESIGDYSLILSERPEGMEAVTQRVSCGLPPGHDSSIVIFSPEIQLDGPNLSSRPSDEFARRFVPWLNKKIDDGKYFIDPDNWLQVPLSHRMFAVAMNTDDPETQIDIKHKRFPRKILKGLQGGNINHQSCAEFTCLVSGPDTTIYLFFADSPSFPDEIKLLLAAPSNEVTTYQKAIAGVVITKIYGRPGTKQYDDAELDELFTSIKGVKFLGSFADISER